MISNDLTPVQIQTLASELGLELNIKNNSTWIECLSPLREESNPSFSFNVKLGSWKDFGTGEKGDIVTLVERLKGLDNKEATKWVAEQTDLASALYGPPKNGYSKPKSRPVDFWNDEHLKFIKAGMNRLKNNPGHELVTTAKSYDCLELETLLKFGCGIIEYWGTEWLAFPYATGCQLYRRENGKRNNRNIPNSKSSMSFFGMKQLTGCGTFFIAKSPRETMLLHQEYGNWADVVGLATGEQGNMSNEQYEALKSKISASSYSKIYTFLDCDTEAAHQIAKEFAETLSELVTESKFTGQIKMVNIDKATGGVYKDITDCIRDEMDANSFNVLLGDAESAKVQLMQSAMDAETAPSIPKEVYQHLPKTLQTRCNLIEQRHRRDIFLISALPVLAAHMPNVSAAHADGYYTPDLFTLIVADPGAGKGTATKAKHLGNVLNKKLMEESRREIQEFQDLPTEAKNKLNEPQERSLFIPANSSSRAIYDVMQSNGGSGLLFETEIDTMLNATGQEWGNFSDITRKAFHHEAVSINRKGEKFFIDNPRLSICITGTFDQFKAMFESAENGHFSRYALYTFDVPRKWQSHRPTKQSRALDESVNTASEILFKMYNALNKRSEPLYIDLTPEQWQAIDDTFAEKMQIIEDLGLSKYLHATNNRAAVLALRMASMFAVLRAYEESPERLQGESVTPIESDMVAALWLANTFVEHAVRLYQILPKAETADSKGERFQQFYDAMPDTFETADAVATALRLNIPERTVKYWLSNDQRIIRKQRGEYAKA